MDSQTLPWIIALVSVALLAAGLTLWLIRHRMAPPRAPLPQEWPLTSRPVFSTDERRVYQQLREALPHHVVLSKLPLVRFCQPDDPQETRYWYELLGSIHVSFAVCSLNGRVLGAIDLESERGLPARNVEIKQAVLAACRVRYLRCTPDELPSAAELQLLVPQSASAPRAPQPAPWQGSAPRAGSAYDEPASAAAPVLAFRSRERTVLWHDSGMFQDSFFSPDSRPDSSPAPLDETPPHEGRRSYG